jgi:fructose-1,6-bisphosphatase/inositol monophosphatase family enzyme
VDELDIGAALAVALEAAQLAIALVAGTPTGPIRTKAHDADLVTDVDTTVERAVRELIATRLPGQTVVGEEFGGVADDGPTWYCDPVDGTTNLAAGLPWTSFSLALAVGSTPLVGVVADPWRGEVMHAARGRGCLVAGRRMTADRPAHRARLTGGVVLTEWAGPLPWPGMLDLLAALADRGATTRVMGSSTLALAHVAAGRCAGAVIGEFHPEDHLAATLLCAEAGCVVRGESGETELFPRRGGVLVAAPQVADELSVLWRAALEAQR